MAGERPEPEPCNADRAGCNGAAPRLLPVSLQDNDLAAASALRYILFAGQSGPASARGMTR